MFLLHCDHLVKYLTDGPIPSHEVRVVCIDKRQFHLQKNKIIPHVIFSPPSLLFSPSSASSLLPHSLTNLNEILDHDARGYAVFLQEPVYNLDHTVAEVGEALQLFVLQLGYDPLQLLVSSMSSFQRERKGCREEREGGRDKRMRGGRRYTISTHCRLGSSKFLIWRLTRSSNEISGMNSAARGPVAFLIVVLISINWSNKKIYII